MITDGIIISPNGDRRWIAGGALHRSDGPAVELADGTRMWYLNGRKHRTDGPAIETGYYTAWYMNDKVHRRDGPAFESPAGNYTWWFANRRHRIGGPAIKKIDGSLEWWYHGIRETESTNHMRVVAYTKFVCRYLPIESSGVQFPLLQIIINYL
jgi:hypothetical protein